MGIGKTSSGWRPMAGCSISGVESSGSVIRVSFFCRIGVGKNGRYDMTR
jgi:hypothetical protein